LVLCRIVYYSIFIKIAVFSFKGWHFGDINVTVTLNLDHTTHITIASGPYNTSILAVVWSRFNVTVTLMSPKRHPVVRYHETVYAIMQACIQCAGIAFHIKYSVGNYVCNFFTNLLIIFNQNKMQMLAGGKGCSPFHIVCDFWIYKYIYIYNPFLLVHLCFF